MSWFKKTENDVKEWDTAIKKMEDNGKKAPISYYKERAIAQRKHTEAKEAVRKTRGKD